MARWLVPLLHAGVLLAGCGEAPERVGWWEQSEPAGPCWDVQLADGLSTTSTDELHGLYRCLNQDDALDAFAGLDASMDETSRTGTPLGIELALLAQGFGGADLDLFGIAGFALDLLDAEDQPLQPITEIALELLYGQPYSVVSADTFTLNSGSALDSGVIVPLMPSIRLAASAILDDGDAGPELLADVLESDQIDDAVCTIIALGDETDPTTSAAIDGLLPHLGSAIEDARSPDNDRWEDASGDSLRDLVEALLVNTQGDGKTALEAMRPELQTLLEDDEVRERLHDLLIDLDRGGELEEVPLWALHLASVDVDGDPLCGPSTSSSCSNGDSALVALIRMLSDADAQVTCSVFSYNLFDDNLAEALLRVIAEWDPDTVISLNAILGTVLDYSWTGSLLDFMLGACDGIDDTAQLVEDLGSLDRLNDPESGHLLGLLIDALGAVYEKDQLDELSPLVDLLGVAFGRELVPPVEETLRDLASSALVSDVVDLVPALLYPDQLPTTRCPSGSEPLSFDATLDILLTATTEDGGVAPIDVLNPALIAVLGQDGTWEAVGNFAALAQRRDATLNSALDLVPTLVNLDPDFEGARGLAPILRDTDITHPALRMAENDALIDAVCTTEITREGPLPFAARLVTGGTLDSVLRTVDVLVDALRG